MNNTIEAEAKNDAAVQDAENILRREYWQQVHGIIEDAKQAILDGEITDTEGLDTWLHETIDGHQWVIYTKYNFFVLLYSDNESAYVDDFGQEGLVRDGAINWAAMAYCAMMADVRASLPDEDKLFQEVEDETE